MTLNELIKAAREELDDKEEQAYLWSDENLIRYANQAEAEACRRARLIVDSTNADVTRIAVEGGEAIYPLDERVIFVRRAMLSGRTITLKPVSIQDLDEQRPGWEAHTGEPSHYIKDYQDGVIRLYPTPTANATLSMTVVRLPLALMTKGNKDKCRPEINVRLHESLVYWMLYRAYMKQDAETRNEKKALENLAFFEQEFGKRSSAVDETWIAREHGYDENEGLF